MKMFIDTLAVFVGRLLELRPTSWQDAALQAGAQRDAIQRFAESQVMINHRITPVKAPESPLAYLGRAILTAIGFIGVLWAVVQVVNAFLAALPFLFIFAVLAWVLQVFGQPNRTAA